MTSRPSKRLLADILGIPAIEVDGYIENETRKTQIPAPPTGRFAHGHALVIGVAHYPQVRPLPETVLDDARDLSTLLVDPAVCGYPPENVRLLLDAEANGANVRSALTDLATRAGPDDTVVVFFSGHGAYDPGGGEGQQYILPYDCDLRVGLSSAIMPHDEMTSLLRSIKAGRLLVMFDSCHSGGAGDPKGILPELKKWVERGILPDARSRKGARGYCVVSPG